MESACGPLISLKARLFRCALLCATQCTPIRDLTRRGCDRSITSNTEFLMSHYSHFQPAILPVQTDGMRIVQGHGLQKQNNWGSSSIYNLPGKGQGKHSRR